MNKPSAPRAPPESASRDPILTEHDSIAIIRVMAQLLVRNVEEKLVRKLKEQAGRHGVSVEEEHRRILRHALVGTSRKKLSFKEFLLSMPSVGEDSDFERGPQLERPVEL